jgi:hypothetical protein
MLENVPGLLNTAAVTSTSSDAALKMPDIK